MIYSFKQLLRATYHDGNDYRCICPPHDASAAVQAQQALLEREAETVDNFMRSLHDHHQEHGLTRQHLMTCFECSSSIPETYVDVAAAGDECGSSSSGSGNNRGDVAFSSKLVIRVTFLEQCQQVVGLNLPAISCRNDNCRQRHILFKKKAPYQPKMCWGFYKTPIKNPNFFDSEYDPWCDSA